MNYFIDKHMEAVYFNNKIEEALPRINTELFDKGESFIEFKIVDKLPEVPEASNIMYCIENDRGHLDMYGYNYNTKKWALTNKES